MILFILSCWFLFGALVFYFLDSHEMKKDIPYGEMPAVPLAWIRKIVFLVCIFLSVPFVISAVIEAVPVAAEVLWTHIRLRLAEYRLQRTIKKATKFIKEIREKQNNQSS